MTRRAGSVAPPACHGRNCVLPNVCWGPSPQGAPRRDRVCREGLLSSGGVVGGPVRGWGADPLRMGLQGAERRRTGTPTRPPQEPAGDTWPRTPGLRAGTMRVCCRSHWLAVPSDSSLSNATPPPRHPGQQPQWGLQVDTDLSVEGQSCCSQSHKWVTRHKVPAPKGRAQGRCDAGAVWRSGDGAWPPRHRFAARPPLPRRETGSPHGAGARGAHAASGQTASGSDRDASAGRRTAASDRRGRVGGAAPSDFPALFRAIPSLPGRGADRRLWNVAF